MMTRVIGLALIVALALLIAGFVKAPEPRT